MPGYNRAELSVELTVVPSSDGALSPREQTEARPGGRRASRGWRASRAR